MEKIVSNPAVEVVVAAVTPEAVVPAATFKGVVATHAREDFVLSVPRSTSPRGVPPSQWSPLPMILSSVSRPVTPPTPASRSTVTPTVAVAGTW